MTARVDGIPGRGRLRHDRQADVRPRVPRRTESTTTWLVPWLGLLRIWRCSLAAGRGGASPAPTRRRRSLAKAERRPAIDAVGGAMRLSPVTRRLRRRPPVRPDRAGRADERRSRRPRGALTARSPPASAGPARPCGSSSRDWPAYTQVQAVVCGDLAIGGSNTCDQSAGQLGSGRPGRQGHPRRGRRRPAAAVPVRGAGRVVRRTGAVDRHPVRRHGAPGRHPAAARGCRPPGSSSATSSCRAAVGGRRCSAPLPSAAWSLTLQNTGTAPAVDPQVSLGVGKGESTEPSSTTTTDLTIEPLQSAEVSVQVGLPIAAFGDFQVVAQVGDDPATASSTTWSAYPWGLIALNVLGLALLLWGIWRRTTARRRAEAAGRAAGHRATADGYALPDVVYVAALGGFLVSPRAASRSRVLRKVEGRLEARDLAALLVGGPRSSTRQLASRPTGPRSRPGRPSSTSPRSSAGSPSAAAEAAGGSRKARVRRPASPRRARTPSSTSTRSTDGWSDAIP